MVDYVDRRRGACDCSSFFPLHSILRQPKDAPGAHARRCMVLLFPVDDDALGLALRAFRLGHGDRQHAILEARLDLCLVDFGA